MNEVFEHLRHDLIFSLSESRCVLRPGGALMLSTPNLRSAHGLGNLLRHGEAHVAIGGLHRNWADLGSQGVMGHVREHTPKEVTEFLRDTGFVVEGVAYPGNDAGSRGWALGQAPTRVWPQLNPGFAVFARKPG